MGAAFLSVSAASIFSPYVGDSERAVADLFSRARALAPAVVFIDEIGAWGCDLKKMHSWFLSGLEALTKKLR